MHEKAKVKAEKRNFKRLSFIIFYARFHEKKQNKLKMRKNW